MRRAALLALLWAGCGAPVAPGPHLAAVAPVDFGRVARGVAATQALEVRNAGTAAMSVTAVALSDKAGHPLAPGGPLGAPEPSQKLPATLSPAASLFVRVSFTAGERGPFEAAVTVETDGGSAVVPVRACGVSNDYDDGCPGALSPRLPVFIHDQRLLHYYDFALLPNRDWKHDAHLAIDLDRFSSAGLSLTGLGKHGAQLEYKAGNTLLVRMRRDFDVEATPHGMVFATTSKQNDDGLAIFGDRFGARTWSNDFKLFGAALTDVLPAKGTARAFGMEIEKTGVTFHTASRRLEPVDLGPGRNYDALNIEGFWLGTNGAELDAFAAGGLWVDRVAVFATALPEDDLAFFLGQLDRL